MYVATKLFIVLFCICLWQPHAARRGSKHRKNSERLNASELERNSGSNRSTTAESANSVNRQDVPEKRRPVKYSLIPQRSPRKRLEKRCCDVGYAAARRKLFCLIDRRYSAKYRNMEHYGRQPFQVNGTPSRKMKRLMHRIERFCIKPQLKAVFFKCCLDGIYGS